MLTERLNAYIEELEAKQEQLKREGCGDEAVLMDVRINVVNIGKTVWQALGRAEKPERLHAAYLARLDGLRSTWQESRSRAEKYGDQDKVMIEDIKLSTLERVLAMYRECAK